MKEYWIIAKEKVASVWQTTSKKQKIIFASVVGAVLVFSLVVAVLLNHQTYQTLFTGLNDQEASEVMAKLQEDGVEYQYQTGGTILVPEKQEETLRAKLAYEGYPKSGFTYDVFKENIDLMTTDFEKNSYKLFELQNRISATIALFDNVQDAKVTIALGEGQKYVLDDTKTDATASVVVMMRDGGSPSEAQVRGIQRLVSRSIPGLKFENIAVLDGNGNDVTVSENGGQSNLNKLKREYERQMEDAICAKVMHVLIPFVGEENVRVSAKGTVDIDKKVKEIINYTPSEDNRGVISGGGWETEMTRDPNAEGGVPGTENNAEVPLYTGLDANGTEQYLRRQENYDYLVSQIKEQIQTDAASLTDLTVSVALNDVEMTDEVMQTLKSLVAKAAGISTEQQDEKIAIANLPFYTETVETQAPGLGDDVMQWLIYVAIVGGILLLLLIILLLMLSASRKKRQKALEEERRLAMLMDAEAEEESSAVLEETLLEEPQEAPSTEEESVPAINELLQIQNERGLELKEKIREFSDENPEIAAQLLKIWLRGGEDNADG